MLRIEFQLISSLLHFFPVRFFFFFLAECSICDTNQSYFLHVSTRFAFSNNRVVVIESAWGLILLWVRPVAVLASIWGEDVSMLKMYQRVREKREGEKI